MYVDVDNDLTTQVTRKLPECPHNMVAGEPRERKREGVQIEAPVFL